MNRFATIPQVETIVSDILLSRWISVLGRPVVLDEIRTVIAEIRKGLKEKGDKFDIDRTTIVRLVDERCGKLALQIPRRVINGTGILIHTNLGRSPISESTWNNALESNCRYATVEFNLETGKRGNRAELMTRILQKMTGCEHGIVVNNNAAAMFLLLASIAKGKRVLVSRGELVQIGGGFRIPEILAQSQATLVEVGTTNITTIDDYLDNIDDQSAMVLKVHRSNFAIRGFTREVSVDALAARLPKHVLLAVDQGSGATEDTVPGETSIRKLFEQGAHIVTFSTDKLLGSVQAGIICGKQSIVESIAQHPLYRVVRPGKTVLTLLRQSLVDRINKIPAITERFARRTPDDLLRMGQKIIDALHDSRASIVPSTMYWGGGSSPDEAIDAMAVRIELPGCASSVAASLRKEPIPVIAYVSDDALMINLGAVFDDELDCIATSLKSVLEKLSCTS
ncbi:MAG: L-seryl-tRNA(Sec) selenium transferase [Spirochaetales bacterium]|nr:L-seryl-tRNA(Sec) selenium transferase [Spirochaetales bacterium]